MGGILPLVSDFVSRETHSLTPLLPFRFGTRLDGIDADRVKR
jgi:hypothetical protein